MGMCINKSRDIRNCKDLILTKIILIIVILFIPDHFISHEKGISILMFNIFC